MGDSQIRSPRDLKYGSSISHRSSTSSDRVTTFDDNRPPPRHYPPTAVTSPPHEDEEKKPYVTPPTTTPNTNEQHQRYYSPTHWHSSTTAVVTLNSTGGVADVFQSHNTTTDSSTGVLFLDNFGFNHSGPDVSFRPTTTLSIASIFLPGENVTVIEVRKGFELVAFGVFDCFFELREQN